MNRKRQDPPPPPNPNPNPLPEEAASQGLFQANEPPHEGPVNDPPPITEETPQPAGAARRGRPPGTGTRRKRTPAAGAQGANGIEPTKEDVEDADFILDMAIYSPGETWLNMARPSEKHAQRMAHLGGRILAKWFAKDGLSDEGKLGVLVGLYILSGFVKKFGGNREQRNNRSIRQEAKRENPLDAPLSQAAH